MTNAQFSMSNAQVGNVDKKGISLVLTKGTKGCTKVTVRFGSRLSALKRVNIECGTGNVEYRSERQLPSRVSSPCVHCPELVEGVGNCLFVH